MFTAIADPEPWLNHTVELVKVDLKVLFAVLGPVIPPLLIFLAVRKWLWPVRTVEPEQAPGEPKRQPPSPVVKPLETKEELCRRESPEWNAARLRRYGWAQRSHHHHHHHHHHRLHQ